MYSEIIANGLPSISSLKQVDITIEAKVKIIVLIFAVCISHFIWNVVGFLNSIMLTLFVCGTVLTIHVVYITSQSKIDILKS